MVLLTKFVSNAVLNPRAEKDGTTRGVLVGCVDRAGRAGRDVFVFLCVFLCIVGCCCAFLRIFSVDHGCLTSSEHPSKARVTQTSLDLAIIF